jgi:hypothetical protein
VLAPPDTSMVERRHHYGDSPAMNAVSVLTLSAFGGGLSNGLPSLESDVSVERPASKDRAAVPSNLA